MSVERIGIVGGGQLGQMLTESAKPMGFAVTVLDPTVRSVEGIGPAPDAPALRDGAEQIVAELNDGEAIRELAKSVDIVTWEIEHIDAATLIELAGDGVDIQPNPLTLRIIKDKLRQKRHLSRAGIPVANFQELEDQSSWETARAELGKVVVKKRFGGFDGRGNLDIDSDMNWDEVQGFFGDNKVYAEQVVGLQKEMAVLVARDRAGSMVAYPAIETIHRNNICEVAILPARIDPERQREAQEIAWETVKGLGGAGIFAVEMFVTDQDDVLVNEIAPRVHNSGHLTMEASRTSQFEQHIRAITGLPLGPTDTISPAAMANILYGPITDEGKMRAYSQGDVHVHLYGKEPRPGAPRKIGHITARAASNEEALEIALRAERELLK